MENMVIFKDSIAQFFYLPSLHNLPHSYYIFFGSTQLKPSSSHNIFGVSFSQYLSLQNHIIPLYKEALKMLIVLRLLRNFFISLKFLVYYWSVVRSCLEYTTHIQCDSTRAALFENIKSKIVCLSTPLLSQTFQSFLLFVDMLCHTFYTKAVTTAPALLKSSRIPSLLRRARLTSLSSRSHPFSIQLGQQALRL